MKKKIVSISLVFLSFGLMFLFVFGVRWFYLAPHYYNDVLSISLKHGVDRVLGRVYSIKNALTSPQQPILWYPKHITIEKVTNGVYTYSLYGYIFSIREHPERVVVNMQNDAGMLSFQLLAEQTSYVPKNIKEIQELSETIKMISHVEYGVVENGNETKRTIQYKDGTFVKHTFCSGDLVRITWEDTRPLDELSGEDGVMRINIVQGNVVPTAFLTIFSNQYATDKRLKQNIVAQCLEESEEL